MRRFLVLQSFNLYTETHKESMLEPVIDFDSLQEANNWINQQEDPSLFEVEDTFSDEDIYQDVEVDNDHDYSYYDMRDTGDEQPDDEFVEGEDD